MKVKCDFSLDAWIKELEIEASSLEEAREKLGKMTLEEIIQEGNIKNFEIKDLDLSIIEQKVKVEVEILDFEPTWFEYETEEEKQRIKGGILSSPKLTLDVEVQEGENLEEEIENKLEEYFEVSGKYRFKYTEKETH